MGKKPVFEIDSKTVIDFDSDFAHKRLCDGRRLRWGAFASIPARFAT